MVTFGVSGVDKIYNVSNEIYHMSYRVMFDRIRSSTKRNISEPFVNFSIYVFVNNNSSNADVAQR